MSTNATDLHRSTMRLASPVTPAVEPDGGDPDEAELVEEEILVEEIFIDGMCGVY